MRRLPRMLARRLIAAASGDGTLRWMAIGSALGILLVAWTAVGVALALKRHDAIEAVLRQNHNLARAYEEQTVRVLATADQATIRLRNAFAADPAMLPDLARFANETGLVPKIMIQLSLADARGRLLASNLDPNGRKSGHVDLSEREHIRAHLAPQTLPAALRLADRDDLFIGKPVLGKVSGKWTIQLSRRIAGADGAPLGVVVASLDPSYFEEVYRRVDLGREGALTLVGADLAVRARITGGRAGGMGTTLSASPIARVGAHAEGQYTVQSAVDGVERLVAYRRVASYPLYLLVASSTSEALAGWRATRDFALVLTLLLSLTVIGGTTFFVSALARIDRSHEALRRSEAAARAANRAKTAFLANMSHEIRTPLTAIIGFADLLLDKRVAAERHDETLRTIVLNGHHLLNVISDILDVSKIEAECLTIELREVPLPQMLHEVESAFGAQARAKSLAFDLRMDGPLPAVLVSDPLRLKQILLNLCSNAVKFTEHGSVCLAARWDECAKQIELSVTDTGIGLTAEQLDRLFQPFVQADASTTRRFGGTGLGLYICKQLAARLEGELTASSEPGVGSRFALRLPVSAAALAHGMVASPSDTAPPIATASGDTEVPALAGRVLVAEDGPYNQRLIAAYIEATGATPTIVDNGERALEQALADSFDLVLMDIQMPVLDGVEATKMLRAAGCDCPIVALTANVMSEDVEQYRRIGCDDVLAKPIDTRRLYALLANYLKPAATHTAAADEIDPVREQLAGQFIAELPATLARIERAAAAHDFDGLRQTTHKLKGIAGSLGWPRLTELAKPIEPAVAAGEHDTALALTDALVAALRELLAEHEATA